MSCSHRHTALQVEAQFVAAWRENWSNWYTTMAGQEGFEWNDAQETRREAGLHEHLFAAFDCPVAPWISIKVMAKVQIIILSLLFSVMAYGQRYEKVPFGDFEQWAVRYITESQIIGGQEKVLYVIGPTDTIRGKGVYDYKNTIWSTSNAFAKVMGVVKTSNNVTPDKGPMGKCAKLATQFAYCKVAGMFNFNVLAAGSIYWGKMLEPVTGVNDPFAFIDWGIPFTKRPKALVLNYKANIPNTGKLVKGTTTRTTEYDGYDPAEILFVLQYRWEDAKGNIHAKRVGTVIYHIDKSSNGWMNDFRLPVIYGDDRESSDFQP